MIIQLVFMLVHFGDIIVIRQFGQDIHTQHFQRMCGEVQLFENVFQGQYFVLFYVEEVQQRFDEFFLLHSLAGFFLFLFFLCLSHNLMSFYLSCKVNK